MLKHHRIEVGSVVEWHQWKSSGKGVVLQDNEDGTWLVEQKQQYEPSTEFMYTWDLVPVDTPTKVVVLHDYIVSWWYTRPYKVGDYVEMGYGIFHTFGVVYGIIERVNRCTIRVRWESGVQRVKIDCFREKQSVNSPSYGIQLARNVELAKEALDKR